jgi:hypothetical protein
MFEPNALGSIDVLLMSFEPGAQTFSGPVADELAVLAEAGFIRVLDVRILVKDDNGDVSDLTLDEMPGNDRFPALDHPVRDIFTARALADLATAVPPGRTAVAVAYLNTWASSLGRAVRRSGGRILATGHVATWVANG